MPRRRRNNGAENPPEEPSRRYFDLRSLFFKATFEKLFILVVGLPIAYLIPKVYDLNRNFEDFRSDYGDDRINLLDQIEEIRSETQKSRVSQEKTRGELHAAILLLADGKTNRTKEMVIDFLKGGKLLGLNQKAQPVFSPRRVDEPASTISFVKLPTVYRGNEKLHASGLFGARLSEIEFAWVDEVRRGQDFEAAVERIGSLFRDFRSKAAHSYRMPNNLTLPTTIAAAMLQQHFTPRFRFYVMLSPHKPRDPGDYINSGFARLDLLNLESSIRELDYVLRVESTQNLYIEMQFQFDCRGLLQATAPAMVISPRDSRIYSTLIKTNRYPGSSLTNRLENSLPAFSTSSLPRLILTTNLVAEVCADPQKAKAATAASIEKLHTSKSWQLLEDRFYTDQEWGLSAISTKITTRPTYESIPQACILSPFLGGPLKYQYGSWLLELLSEVCDGKREVESIQIIYPNGETEEVFNRYLAQSHSRPGNETVAAFHKVKKARFWNSPIPTPIPTTSNVDSRDLPFVNQVSHMLFGCSEPTGSLLYVIHPFF